MSITSAVAAAGKLPDILFPAIPPRTGRIAATLVAAATLVTVWAPAAITTWPMASVPGATVSSALGVALLGGIRALLLRAWRQAATGGANEESAAFFGSLGAVLIGGAVSYVLLTGDLLSPESRLSHLAAAAVALWGAHEAVYFHREHHLAKH